MPPAPAQSPKRSGAQAVARTVPPVIRSPFRTTKATAEETQSGMALRGTDARQWTLAQTTAGTPPARREAGEASTLPYRAVYQEPPFAGRASVAGCASTGTGG